MKILTASFTGAIATLCMAAPTIANPIYLPNNTVQIYTYPTQPFPTAYPRYRGFRQPYQLPPSRPTPVLPGPTLLPAPQRSQIPIVTYPSVQVYPQTRSIYQRPVYQYPVQRYPTYSQPGSSTIYIVPGSYSSPNSYIIYGSPNSTYRVPKRFR